MRSALTVKVRAAAKRTPRLTMKRMSSVNNGPEYSHVLAAQSTSAHSGEAAKAAWMSPTCE
jgi:hypothetical protein